MKTILITGVNKGLGEALLTQLVAKGYVVFGLLRNPTQYHRLVAAQPPNVTYILADVAQDTCIATLQQALGNTTLDLVINNAGIQGEGSTVATATAQEIADLVNVHCLGAFRVMKAVSHNVSEKNATVINVNSRLGSIYHQAIGTFKEMEVSYAYRIAKAAQNMLTASLRLEFENVTFVSLTPGRLATPAAYEASAQRIIAHWEQGNFQNTNGILEVPDQRTEW